MSYNPKVYLQVARNALTSALEYRSNYYILILSSFITVAMELAVFRQVYAVNEVAGDLHAAQAVSFIVLGMIVRTVSMEWALVREAVDQIRDGSFRRFLLQPIHFPSFFISQFAGPKAVAWVMCFLTIVVLRFVPGFEALLPPGTRLQFAAALIVSLALVLNLYLTIIYLGFYFEEASFLMIAFNIGIGIFSGSAIPISWMPPMAAQWLNYTFLPLIGDFPVRAGLGTLAAGEFAQRLLAGVLWLAAGLVINNFLRRWAYRAYEAYGG